MQKLFILSMIFGSFFYPEVECASQSPDEAVFSLLSHASIELGRCRAHCLDDHPQGKDKMHRVRCWDMCAIMTRNSRWKTAWGEICIHKKKACGPGCQTVCRFFASGNAWPPKGESDIRTRARVEFVKDPALKLDCHTLAWETPTISKNIMGTFHRLKAWDETASRLVYVIFAKDYQDAWYLLGQTLETEYPCRPQDIDNKAYIRILVVAKTGLVARKTIDLSRSVWCPRMSPHTMTGPVPTIWHIARKFSYEFTELVNKWYMGEEIPTVNENARPATGHSIDEDFDEEPREVDVKVDHNEGFPRSKNDTRTGQQGLNYQNNSSAVAEAEAESEIEEVKDGELLSYESNVIMKRHISSRGTAGMGAAAMPFRTTTAGVSFQKMDVGSPLEGILYPALAVVFCGVLVLILIFFFHKTFCCCRRNQKNEKDIYDNDKIETPSATASCWTLSCKTSDAIEEEEEEEDNIYCDMKSTALFYRVKDFDPVRNKMSIRSIEDEKLHRRYY